MDADRGDLPRRPPEPDAREGLEPRSLDAERRERLDQRFLEVTHVLLHVAPVPVQIEDRVADELSRAVECRFAAAVRLDDLHLGAGRDVELLRLVRPAAERDDGRMLEQEDRVGDRALRDGSGDRPLDLPRLEIRRLAELEQIAAGRHRLRLADTSPPDTSGV